MEVATPRFMKLEELQKIYQRWMHTPKWTYACQFFLGEASSKIS